MKRWLLLGAVVLAVLAVVLWRDPSISRLVSSQPVPRATPALAPDYARTFADAFCRADAKYLAANTRMPNITEEIVAGYLAGDPPCTAVRYLGLVNDAGEQRTIFVLSYEGGREDWFAFTWTDGKLTDLRRG